jgi:ATP-dependent RNA helicase SUPV3L1/SUV3
LGARAIRIDMLERLADILRTKDSRVGFEATPDMLSITGMTLEQFAGLMEGLGYKGEKAERPKTKAAPAPGTLGIPLPAFGAVQQLGLPALPAMNLAVNPAMLASVAPPQPPKMVAVKTSGSSSGPQPPQPRGRPSRLRRPRLRPGPSSATRSSANSRPCPRASRRLKPSRGR